MIKLIILKLVIIIIIIIGDSIFSSLDHNIMLASRLKHSKAA